LPPFLLGALGLVADGLVSVAFLVYAFIALGILPSLGPTVTAWLSEVLPASSLANALSTWLGWSTEELARAITGPLGQMSSAEQDAVLLASVVLGLALLLAVIVVLYLSWVACWSKPVCPEENGGN
jgi:cytochrome bd-type quinol oxidase subunit 1